MDKPALSFMPATLKLAQEKGLVIKQHKPETKPANRFERMTFEELLDLTSDIRALRRKEGTEVALQALDALTKAHDARKRKL